jgi:hypothetical protein
VGHPEQQPQRAGRDLAKGVGLALLALPVQTVVTGIVGGFITMAGLPVRIPYLAEAVQLIYLYAIYQTVSGKGNASLRSGVLAGIALFIILRGIFWYLAR